MIRLSLGVVCKSCFLLLLVSLAANSAFAQLETATVSGQVVDPSGLSITGAQVKLVDIDRDTATGTATNPSGLYTFPSIRPGRYRMEVTAAGFKVVNVTGMTVNVQDHLEQNFKLAVGSVSESITVESGAALVDTESAAVSTVIGRNFVENMPLNGRSFQDLLTLAPGVAMVGNAGSGGNTAVGSGGEITVNGQRTEANYFTVDGVSANTGTAPGNFGAGAGYGGGVPGESALGTTQSLVSIDALQEFRSSTSTYSAEYGRTPGGQFSFVTRSGTKAWHGAAYDYLRNDALDANNWFNTSGLFGLPITPRQPERQNDFGATLGGPIIIPSLYNGRNKSFFFFSYEGLRLLQPQPVTPLSVPDSTLRQNAPSALQPVLNAFPLPNGGEDGLNDGLAFYQLTVSNPSNLDSVSVRIDHSFSDKLKVFGRYADTQSNQGSYFQTNQLTNNVGIRTLTLGATSLITGRQANDLRFNITQNNSSFLEKPTTLGGAIPLDLGTIPGPGAGGFPPPEQGSSLVVCLCYGGFPQYGVAQGPAAQRQFNVVDTYSWTVGTHNLKFGVDWRRLATKVTPTHLGESATYSSEASVLSNTADFASAFSNAPSVVEPVYTNFSAFVQDEWKATPRLSLSLGLRWDVDPPPGTVVGLAPYTVTQITDLATTQLAPAGTPLWRTTWNNLAPRLGMAYQLRQSAGHETVLRGGFGMFYDMGNTQGTQGLLGVGLGATLLYSGVSFPLTSAQLQLSPPSVAPPYNNTVYAFDPNLKLPYTLQWNAALEQAFGGKQALTLSYVGSNGRRLLSQFDYFPGQLGNPNFGSLDLQLTTNRAVSNYNALQVQYQKQLSHGLQVLASYTWSHSIDDASSNFLLYQLLHSSSDFDIRHNFQAALTYDLPGTYSNPVMSGVLKHWGLDSRITMRSSLPVNIVGTTSVSPTTHQFENFEPNLVAGQPLYVDGSQYPGRRGINFNAFTAAPTGINGNTPRNYARGFNAVQADLALRREFPIRDRLRLQFRAEAFNIFNRPNFGSLYNQLALGPTLFGYAYSTLNNSLGGLSPLYQVGGPRSLQVMLRLNF
jgi:hypothetical protein